MSVREKDGKCENVRIRQREAERNTEGVCHTVKERYKEKECERERREREER